MPAKTVSLDVTIMGREFRVSCPEGERQSLIEAAAYLDRRMREIRDAGKVIGVERIAIMAALNITHDLLISRMTPADNSDIQAQVRRLGGMLDSALAQQDNLL